MISKDTDWRIPLRALALTMAVWVIFSWPLPLHMTHAIPAASTKAGEQMAIQPMQPGDHLQLEYHFWLLGDMLAGKTPWFHNLYEFNTGNDAERREPGAYYLPFSLVHTAGSWIAGRAFGWNLAGLVALWLTAWFTFLLARRYTDHAAAAWLAAAAAIALPYRWINIAGGSPTGFGMAFVPLLFYGLDLAVRDDKLRGGVLAGLALLFAGWSDPHTFFFCALATPFWCLFAFVHRPAFAWRAWRSYTRLAVTLAPVAVFAALAYLSNSTNTKHIGESRSAVRTFAEIGLFSPFHDGLWSWAGAGISDHIYVGAVAPALALAGLVLGFRKKRFLATWLMIAAAVFVAVELAMGPNGVHGGYFFRLARRLVPPYGMIRQPAKVFCLMPTLVAMAIVISASAFRSPRAAAALLGCLLLLEWRLHFEPTVSRFTLEEPAYAAVAAASVDRNPHALILPVWPGDAHYTSVYEHNVSLHRIRMLNGYRPYVSKDYVAFVRSLESANQGVLSDAQLDDLQRRGIDFVIFHENLFPERVSAFPSTATLKCLLHHPRLQLLKQSGPVWSFRIVAPPSGTATTPPLDHALAPAIRLEWESAKPDGLGARTDAQASDGSFTRLGSGESVTWPATVHAPRAENLRWLARVRGSGSLSIGAGNITSTLAIASDDWTWIEAPVGGSDELVDATPSASCGQGQVDMDSSLLVAGPWRLLAPNESIELPASAFFHAGYSRLESSGVVFAPEYNGPGLVLNGPRLPVAPGRYHIRVDVASPAPAGTELGTMIVRHEGGPDVRTFPIHASGENSLIQTLTDNRPLMLALAYHGNDACEVKRVVLERLP